MAKSKEELIYDIENELVDPTTNKITGERVKARLLDMVDAMGTGGGGTSQMKYYRVEPLSNAAELVYVLGSLLKVYVTEDASQIHILTPLMSGNPFSLDSHFTLMGAAVDLSLRLMESGEILTIGEYFDSILDAMGGGSLEDMGAFEITEEEFYTI